MKLAGQPQTSMSETLVSTGPYAFLGQNETHPLKIECRIEAQYKMNILPPEIN